MMLVLQKHKKDLDQQLRIARLQYEEQVEQELSNSDAMKMWDSIQGMTNMNSKQKALAALNENEKAN